MSLYDITEKNIRTIAADSGVLERGYDYYLSGNVASLEVVGDTLQAEVEGSYANMYDVMVAVDEDGGIEAECDCPYDGWACKHIVAVLYSWLHDERNTSGAAEEETPDLASRLKALSKERLIENLLNIAKRDMQLRRDLFLMTEQSESGKEAQGKKKMESPGLKMALNQINGAVHGFLDYYEVPGVVGTLEEVLEAAESASPQDEVEIAWATAEGGLKAIEHADDSDGMLGDAIGKALGQFAEAFHKLETTPEEREAWLEKLLWYVFNHDYGLEEPLAQAALGICETEQDYDCVIGEITSEIASLGVEDYRRGWLEEFLTETYLRKGDEEQFLKRRQASLRFERDYLQLADFWVAKGKMDRAIEVAEEGLVETKGAPYMFSTQEEWDLCTFLEGIYSDKGDKENLRRILQVHFEKAPSLELYRKVKELSESLGDWEPIRKALTETAERGYGKSTLLDIYFEEGQIDQAIRMAQSGELYYTDKVRVAEAVKRAHPEVALDLYDGLVKEYIGKANRKGYHIAAGYAAKVKEIMTELLGDRTRWEAYIGRIREENRRRPALQDEFKSL